MMIRSAPHALLTVGLVLIAGCDNGPAEPRGPVELTVITPIEGQTVNRTFRVKASCSGGCRRLRVYKAAASMADREMDLATGGTSIDRDVSLGGLTGELHIVVTADDGSSADWQEFTVYAMDASNVTEVIRAPGPILDFDGTRALYGQRTPEGWRILLGVGDAASDRVLRQGSGRPDYGVIVNPDLVLFTLWRNGIGPSYPGNYYDPTYPDTDSLFEWRSGTISLLSATSRTRRPPVDGGITAWQDGVISSVTWREPDRMPLHMRDLGTGATTTLSTLSATGGIDVGAGRTVAWADRVGEGPNASTEIVWWRDGAVTRLGTTPDTSYMAPLTDGTSLAFQTTRCCRVELQAPQGRQLLADYVPQSSQPWSWKYQVESGFVAFSRPETGRPTYEVLLRRPDGTTTTVASSVVGWAPPSIRLVTGTGALVYGDVLVRPGIAARTLGSGGATVIERNGSYFLVYGNAVYRVN